MECPSCGAKNSASARWCTLCLRVFDPGEPVDLVPAGSEGRREVTVATSQVTAYGAGTHRASGISLPVSGESMTASASTTSTRATSLGISVDAPGVLTWKCYRCQTCNEIETIDCRVCGWSLFEPLKEKRVTGPEKVEPRRVRLWSLIPGGGQWIQGMRGQAIARGSLVVWLLALSVLLSNSLVRWAQVIFMAGGLAVWIVSAVDALRLARAESEQLLAGRRLALAFVASLVMVFSVSFLIGWTVANSNRNQPGYLTERTDPATGAVVQEPAAGQTVAPPSGEGTYGGGSSLSGEAPS